MKTIKKCVIARIILTLTLCMSNQISASENINRIIQELRAQEAIASTTIAQWPIFTSTSPADTPALASLKSLVERDIQNIKNDLKKMSQAIIMLIKKQQEILTIINK